MDACVKDDIYQFKTDGTYILDNGATKCYPDEPQIVDQGTWAFNVDETIINFDNGDEWNIEQLTSTTFVTYYTELWPDDGLYRKETITMTAQ